MALVQADLDRLEAAIAKGTLTVEYDGKRVTYRSISELTSAAEYVRGQLAAAAETAVTQTFATHSKV